MIKSIADVQEKLVKSKTTNSRPRVAPDPNLVRHLSELRSVYVNRDGPGLPLRQIEVVRASKS